MAPPVLALSEIPTVSTLYRDDSLSWTSANRTAVQSLNNIISIIRYDITRLQVQGIVNAANSSLMGGGGVDGAIHTAAGRELARECATLNRCEVGDAKITAGYNLPCEKVVHTVGPIYHRERNRDPERPEMLLRSCYRRSLELAVENDIKTIAFPAISAGIYGYPSRRAAFAATDEVRKFLEEPENMDKLDRIIFCTFDRKDEISYETVIPYIFPPTEADMAKEESASEAAPEDQVAKHDSRHEDALRQDDAARKDDLNFKDNEAPKDNIAPKNESASTDNLASKEDLESKPESGSMEDVAPKDEPASNEDLAPNDTPEKDADVMEVEASKDDVSHKGKPASNEELARKGTFEKDSDAMEAEASKDDASHKDEPASNEDLTTKDIPNKDADAMEVDASKDNADKPASSEDVDLRG